MPAAARGRRWESGAGADRGSRGVVRQCRQKSGTSACWSPRVCVRRGAACIFRCAGAGPTAACATCCSMPSARPANSGVRCGMALRDISEQVRLEEESRRNPLRLNKSMEDAIQAIATTIETRPTHRGSSASRGRSRGPPRRRSRHARRAGPGIRLTAAIHDIGRSMCRPRSSATLAPARDRVRLDPHPPRGRLTPDPQGAWTSVAGCGDGPSTPRAPGRIRLSAWGLRGGRSCSGRGSSRSPTSWEAIALTDRTGQGSRRRHRARGDRAEPRRSATMRGWSMPVSTCSGGRATASPRRSIRGACSCRPAAHRKQERVRFR